MYWQYRIASKKASTNYRTACFCNPSLCSLNIDSSPLPTVCLSLEGPLVPCPLCYPRQKTSTNIPALQQRPMKYHRYVVPWNLNQKVYNDSHSLTISEYLRLSVHGASAEHLQYMSNGREIRSFTCMSADGQSFNFRWCDRLCHWT